LSSLLNQMGRWSHTGTIIWQEITHVCGEIPSGSIYYLIAAATPVVVTASIPLWALNLSLTGTGAAEALAGFLLGFLPALLASPVLFSIYLSRDLNSWRFRAVMISLAPNYAFWFFGIRYLTLIPFISQMLNYLSLLPFIAQMYGLWFDFPAFTAIALAWAINRYPHSVPVMTIVT
jgi:hypothetical protein